MSPARWATPVKQASPKASPQAARRTSPPLALLPPPPSYETTFGDNAPLYSMRSPAAMLAAHANAHAATTETEYPSKFLALYYIDMMLGFIDDFATCCIGMLSGIENVEYIMAHPHFKEGVINKLIRFAEKIKSVRYKYKQGDKQVDIETEVKQIELFLREKGLQSYTSLKTYGYYEELRHIWNSLGHPNRGKKIASKQYAHISTILRNPQYSDEKKLEEIQKYTTKENKPLVVMVNETTRLNKMSLVSLDEKLKLLTEQIKELESIINQKFWTTDGIRNYNEYLEIVRRRGTQGTLGGKKRTNAAKAAKQRSVVKRGGVGSSFRRLFGMNDKGYQVIPVNEDVSQDYMTVLNIYKDGHIEKVRQLYNTIVFIYNYAEYHRKIASEDALIQHQYFKKEYEYLLTPVIRFDERKSRNGEEQKFEILTNSQKQKLELLRKSPSSILQAKRPDLTDTAHFVRHILQNFKILKGRKVELERKITLYYA
jgi:hypothetical protein